MSLRVLNQILTGPALPSTPSGWEIANAIVMTLATVAVAFVAIKEIRDKKAQRKEAREAADADVSGRAFMLRRDLLTWLGEDATHEARRDHLDAWLRQDTGPTRLDGVFKAAEDASTQLLAASLHASKAVAEAVRLAHIRLVAGIGRVKKFSRESRPHGWLWIHLQRSAVTDLTECVALLEAEVIDGQLLADAKALEKQRASQEPFKQLSEAVLAEIERSEAAQPLPPPSASAPR